MRIVNRSTHFRVPHSRRTTLLHDATRRIVNQSLVQYSLKQIYMLQFFVKYVFPVVLGTHAVAFVKFVCVTFLFSNFRQSHVLITMPNLTNNWLVRGSGSWFTLTHKVFKLTKQPVPLHTEWLSHHHNYYRDHNPCLSPLLPVAKKAGVICEILTSVHEIFPLLNLLYKQNSKCKLTIELCEHLAP